MQPINGPPRISRFIRAAVACALVGLLGALLFLWSGFTPWTLTFGVMLGFPLLLVAILLYVIVVARDLRQHGLF
jgi:uncharacterized membrane protein YgaE (UPF0421/DUF939 family)